MPPAPTDLQSWRFEVNDINPYGPIHCTAKYLRDYSKAIESNQLIVLFGEQNGICFHDAIRSARQKIVADGEK